MVMTAPGRASGKSRVVRMYSNKHSCAMRHRSLSRSRLKRKYGRSILGMPKVKCRCGTGNRIVSVSNAPKSWTFFWWQDGQNQRPLQEKASKYSCWQ